MKNIRSYSDEKINFPRGITLFEGDIGSGKSTILMAIEFGLFGIGKNGGNSLLKTNEESGFTKLGFSVDDNTYEICRNLKRKNKKVNQSSGYIIEGEEKTNLSATELKKRIIQILKFNEPSENRSYSRIFRYAIYTPQEEMKIVLSDSDLRLQVIRKAFELDAYKEAILNANLIAGHLDKISARLETTVKNLEKNETTYFNTQRLIAEKHTIQGELITQISDFEKKIKNMKDKLLELQNDEKSLIKMKEEDKRISDDNNSIEKEIEEKRDENITFEDKIKSNTKKITELKTITKPTEMSVEQINKKIEDYRRNESLRNDAETEIEKRKSRLYTLSEILGENTKLVPGMINQNIKNFKEKIFTENKQLATEEKNGANLQEIKTQLQVKIKGIKEKLEKFAKLNFQCPTCEQQIDEKYVQKIEIELNETLEQNKKSLQENESNLEVNANITTDLKINLEKNKDVLKDLIAQEPLLTEYLHVERDIKERKHQNDKLAEKIRLENESESKDTITYYLDLSSKLQEYESSKIHLETITDENSEIRIKISASEEKIRILKKKLNSNIASKNKLGEKINSLKNIQRDVDNHSELLSDTNQEYMAMNEKNASIKAEKTIFENRLHEIKKEIQICENAKSKYDRCNNFREWIKEVFVPILEQMEVQIMQYLQYDFNNIYQKWYYMLVDDPSKESRIDEDFTPIVEQEGYEIGIEHLSGGEKTSIALAYRLTLNSMLRRETESLKTNILILDEPTDGFSKSQLSKVKSILTELKSEQIILVSHERELEGYAQNIFQITKGNGISKITKLN